MVKCGNCGSSRVYVDAEEDFFWCKSCNYKEAVNYSPMPEGCFNLNEDE